MNIRVVDASRALVWFQGGFELFRKEPLVWIVQTVIFIAVLMLIGMVPLAGQLVATLLSAVFAGGFLWTCEQGRLGQPMKIDHLFEGFRRTTNPLLIVGAIYAVGNVIAGIIAGMLVMGAGLGVGVLTTLTGGAGPGMAMAVLLPMMIVLVALLLSFPLAMAVWFAPPLVLFDGMAPMEAMKMSFIACYQNWAVLLMFGVIFLVLALLASIPFGLGWLVLAPTLVGASYYAYREIFQPRQALQAA